MDKWTNVGKISYKGQNQCWTKWSKKEDDKLEIKKANKQDPIKPLNLQFIETKKVHMIEVLHNVVVQSLAPHKVII